MPVSNSPGLTTLDAEAMQHAVEDTVDGTLRSFVEFTADDFELLYVDDVTLSFYDDETHMVEHFEEIHSYVHIDFTETDFFTDRLFPVASDVRYHATSLDAFTLVRIYFDDEGLFVALDRDEPVEPVVGAVEDVYGS